MSWWNWFHPKPPQPPALTVCRLTVCDPNRALIPNLRSTLEIETEPGVFYHGVQKERVEFTIPSTRVGHGAYLALEATGFSDYLERVAAVPELGEVILQPIPAVSPVLRLYQNGVFFRTADGARHFLKDATGFMDAKLFHDGNFSKLDTHLSQISELGFNCSRTFLSAKNLFDFALPLDELVDLLPKLVRYKAARGVRSNLVAFADAPLIGWGLDELLERWARMGAALQTVQELGPLYSLVNEVSEPANVFDTTPFAHIDGILCSRGSRGSRGAPVRPWMDWEEYHDNNEQQHWREPHNGREFAEGADQITASHAPMHMSETRRPDNDPNPGHHRDAGQCASLLIAGYCFHCDELRTCEPVTGMNLECAIACIEGMDSIPVECQPGPYRHRQDLEQPDAGATGERAYQRGDADVCIAHSHP